MVVFGIVSTMFVRLLAWMAQVASRPTTHSNTFAFLDCTKIIHFTVNRIDSLAIVCAPFSGNETFLATFFFFFGSTQAAHMLHWIEWFGNVQQWQNFWNCIDFGQIRKNEICDFNSKLLQSNMLFSFESLFFLFEQVRH